MTPPIRFRPVPRQSWHARMVAGPLSRPCPVHGVDAGVYCGTHPRFGWFVCLTRTARP